MSNTILITGGAGFVGSSLALMLKQEYHGSSIIALDNLKRRGSELNVPRLLSAGVDFVHGDIRLPEDLTQVKGFDLLIDCAAEPSVMAGYTDSPKYIINTNLNGTANCLELARKHQADIIFISTSRVYPIKKISQLNFSETDTRFVLTENQAAHGVSNQGITEQFPMDGARSLYGASKLASELLITEYANLFGINAVINRCGVLAGPWQMGKEDQGFLVLWVARHLFQGSLSYFGYGGTGRQVRDILHVRDLYNLLNIQLNNLSHYSSEIFNVGGGQYGSISLVELTELCREITGKRILIDAIPDERPGDIPWYISDCTKVRSIAAWEPSHTIRDIVQEVSEWISANEKILRPILT